MTFQKFITMLLVIAIAWCIGITYWYAYNLIMPYTPPATTQNYGSWVSATNTPFQMVTTTPEDFKPNPGYNPPRTCYKFDDNEFICN